jgi:hypothetical protein
MRCDQRTTPWSKGILLFLPVFLIAIAGCPFANPPPDADGEASLTI